MSKEARRAKRHEKAVEVLARAERRLTAAFTRWQKAREALRRYEKLAEKEFNQRSEIGGTFDWTRPF